MSIYGCNCMTNKYVLYIHQSIWNMNRQTITFDTRWAGSRQLHDGKVSGNMQLDVIYFQSWWLWLEVWSSYLWVSFFKIILLSSSLASLLLSFFTTMFSPFYVYYIIFNFSPLILSFSQIFSPFHLTVFVLTFFCCGCLLALSQL